MVVSVVVSVVVLAVVSVVVSGVASFSGLVSLNFIFKDKNNVISELTKEVLQ